MDSNTYIKSFQLFDKDEKGFIGKHELRQLFRSFGQYLSDKDLRLIVAEGDLNGDGKISIQEFVGLMKRRMRSAWESGTDDLLRLFKIFDIDGNGVIDKHELRHVCNFIFIGIVMDAVGHFVTEEDVEEMMLAADLDGNGSIDYNDFLTFLADLNETKLN
ncbi:hypothetical protein Zmor_024821 [Zophobas morio]|uniref:EF-hand domain-containing protein n=1 Tax=Zophobas morio TaxID=2755281 RepID=A0AA38LZN2_9CUCU|nr:hypothetical protein Zmor_024821 [Zophobas morio]